VSYIIRIYICNSNPITKQVSISGSASDQSSIHTLQEITSDDTEDTSHRTILVIGVTGAGKSSLCNFYFQESICKVSNGRISVAEDPTVHCHTINGRQFHFIDTPGFCDEYQSNDDRMMDVATALYHAKHGVHAIVICMNGEIRQTTADKDLLEELNALGTFWPHAFVVFTNGATMGETEEDRKQKVLEWRNSRRCPPSMKKLLEYVKLRYMVVECTNTSSEYHQQKCIELYSFVEGILIDNYNQCYNNPLFV